MKLIIASGIYPPDIGGPATYSQLIAKEFIKQGIDVSVICYSDKMHEDNEKFKIIRILRKNKPSRYWSYFWNLFKLARNCDVIYAQGPLAAGLPTMWVSKILRKKFVIKIVGDYAWEQGVNQFEVNDLIEEFSAQGGPASGGQKRKYPWQVELIRKIQTKVVKSADKVIVPSEFLKKIVKGWGVDGNKISVVYNSFDGRGLTQIKSRQVENTQINADISASISVSPKADNQRVSADISANIIISAGRPEPWKGFNTLNEIMPDLLKENPEFKLIIATKMPHNELMEHFRSSGMFVLNSGYEGFSHMILEAMNYGLPVITTNVCGNPEIVQNGENGLLVEYNNKEQIKNAILKIWKDKNLKEKIINNGYKTLEKFKLDDTINKTLEILKA